MHRRHLARQLDDLTSQLEEITELTWPALPPAWADRRPCGFQTRVGFGPGPAVRPRPRAGRRGGGQPLRPAGLPLRRGSGRRGSARWHWRGVREEDRGWPAAFIRGDVGLWVVDTTRFEQRKQTGRTRPARAGLSRSAGRPMAAYCTHAARECSDRTVRDPAVEARHRDHRLLTRQPITTTV